MSINVRLVIFSRLLVIAIQFAANHLLADHDAGVFEAPIDDASQPRPLDAAINLALGGFRRWDAHYYLHIAEHGYTYEQSLAFYPLFPGVVHLIARLLHSGCALHHLVSFRELLLCVAVALNIFAFVRASQTLYRLTELVHHNAKLARHAQLLFTFNPAAVFFTAPYTESLFAWMTFATMERCQRKRYASAVLPLCLSIACRSNGIVNCGFVLFHVFNDVLGRPVAAVRHLSTLATALTAAAFAFAAVQYHQYRLFCVDAGGGHIAMAPAVRAYGERNGFVLAGEFGRQSNSSWCYAAVPMAYAYVQAHYWHCDLFAYYQWKQWPNFLLAAPVLFVFARGIRRYGRRQWREVCRGTPVHVYHLLRDQRTVDQRQLVYVVHAAVLTLVCVGYVHIQVSTRLLASASPCLYWFCALRWDGGGLFRLGRFVRDNRAVSAWCAGYLVIGTVLFSNHLPWT